VLTHRCRSKHRSGAHKDCVRLWREEIGALNGESVLDQSSTQPTQQITAPKSGRASQGPGRGSPLQFLGDDDSDDGPLPAEFANSLATQLCGRERCDSIYGGFRDSGTLGRRRLEENLLGEEGVSLSVRAAQG
jgi:hypothetical protein